MLARFVLTALLVLTSAPASAGEEVRYFATWSYAQNSPRDEIKPSTLAGRRLGYWQLRFDAAGGVLEGIRRSASGATWLTFRYVEVDGRIYADLFRADESYVTRKSTLLRTRAPRWPVTDPPAE